MTSGPKFPWLALDSTRGRRIDSIIVQDTLTCDIKSVFFSRNYQTLLLTCIASTWPMCLCSASSFCMFRCKIAKLPLYFVVEDPETSPVGISVLEKSWIRTLRGKGFISRGSSRCVRVRLVTRESNRRNGHHHRFSSIDSYSWDPRYPLSGWKCRSQARTDMLRTQEGYCDNKRGGRCTCWSVTFEAGYQDWSNFILCKHNNRIPLEKIRY